MKQQRLVRGTNSPIPHVGCHERANVPCVYDAWSVTRSNVQGQLATLCIIIPYRNWVLGPGLLPKTL